MVEWREPPVADWRERLRAKAKIYFGFMFRPWMTTYPEKGMEQEAEQEEKLNLLYAEMMKDIEASDVSENIKKGLDPLPAMVAYLLAAAGGGAVGMILSSLLAPYVQTKLTYPLMKMALPYRLAPFEVITAWRRRHEPEFWADLKDQGWNDERIEALKKITEVMPTPEDLTTWMAHEVFEPDMREKYGLDDEWEAVEATEAVEHWFERIGMPMEVAKNKWRAHWVHPALGTVFTLLHRGLITEQDMYDFYRLVEIAPYWRDKLTEISWDIPNRIELRMMTRYLGLGKDYITGMLEKVGLAEEYRGDVADFMIAMGVRTDLATRYRNRWITSDELWTEITETGLSSTIAEKLYKWIVKNEAPQRVEETRALTRALIIKGVKKEVIDRNVGLELLMRHQNYAFAEATFVLDVELGALGSPETPLEFRQLVEEYRASQGLEFKEIPQEVIEAEKALIAVSMRLKQARETAEAQEVIDQLEVEVAEVQVRFDILKAQHEL